MAIIGNRKDATTVLMHHHGDAYSDAVVKIGSGGYRTCYSLNDVCYKVSTSDYGDGYESPVELRNAQYLRRRFGSNDGMVGAYVRIPKTSGFSIPRKDYAGNPYSELVIAMELIDGDMPGDAPYNREAREELWRLGFRDMHGKNFFVERSTGYLVPVDLASPRRISRDELPDFRVFGRDGGWDDLMRAEQERIMRARYERTRKPSLPGWFDTPNACNNESCRDKRAAKNLPEVRWCWDFPETPRFNPVGVRKGADCGVTNCAFC